MMFDINTTWGHRSKLQVHERDPVFCQIRQSGLEVSSAQADRVYQSLKPTFFDHFLLHSQGTSEPLVCQADTEQGESSLWPSWGVNKKEIGGKSIISSVTGCPDQIDPGRQGFLSFKSKAMVGPDKSKTSAFPTSALALKSSQKCISPDQKRQKLYVGTTAAVENYQRQLVSSICTSGSQHSHSCLLAHSHRKELQQKLSHVTV